MGQFAGLACVLLGSVSVWAAEPSPARSLEALSVYGGSWLVTPKPAEGEAPHTDQLTNRCLMGDTFYTCEQVVNGKAVALLVFTPGKSPGTYHSTIVMPDGVAGARPGDLTISGQHWTYLNKDGDGKPSFRVDNVVTDRDHIHFEQFKATPGGGWERVGEGDEVRTTSP